MIQSYGAQNRPPSRFFMYGLPKNNNNWLPAEEVPPTGGKLIDVSRHYNLKKFQSSNRN